MKKLLLIPIILFCVSVQAQESVMKYFQSQTSLITEENFENNSLGWNTSNKLGKHCSVGASFLNLITDHRNTVSTSHNFDFATANDFIIETSIELKKITPDCEFGFILGSNTQYKIAYKDFSGNLITTIPGDKPRKTNLKTNYKKSIKLSFIKHGKILQLFINNNFELNIPFHQDVKPQISYFISKAGAIKVNYLRIYSDVNQYLTSHNLNKVDSKNLKTNVFDTFDSNNTDWELIKYPQFSTTIQSGKYVLISSNSIEKTILQSVKIDKNDDFSIEACITRKSADPFGRYGIIWNVFNDKIYQGLQIINNKVYYIDQSQSSEKKDYLTTLIPKLETKFQIIKSENELSFFINDYYLKSIAFEGLTAQQLGFYTKQIGGLAIDYIKVYSGSFTELNVNEIKSAKEPAKKAIKKIKEPSKAVLFTSSDQINIPREIKNTDTDQIAKDGFAYSLPPILLIDSLSFSKSSINAGESASLLIRIKNIGPGDAKDVYLDIKSNMTSLNFPNQLTFPLIKANGGQESIEVKIDGGINLPTSFALLKINVIEPNFKVKIQGKQIKFQTKEFQKPEMILAKFAVLEKQSANPNNEINLNEIIDVKIAIQNIGRGSAKDVKLKVANNQKGVMLLGVVEDSVLVRKEPIIGCIEGGQFKTITYRYFVNSEFSGNQLNFTINSTEKCGRYGFIDEKNVQINSKLQEEGYIRNFTLGSTQNINEKGIIIEDIFDFAVDVDTNIPITENKNIHRYAIVIGNEDYRSKQEGLKFEQNVEFAVNDARVFASYCEKILGIPQRQIKLLKNSTAAEMKQAIAWIQNLAAIENGNAEIFFYYSGHGLPHESTKETYLIPVDVSGTNLEYAIKLQDLYNQLSNNPSKNITVFLDACFSGGGRNQGLLAMKGVKVKPKAEFLLNNMVVFSSSTGDESSSVYREKQHGYFTYYLLKKLKDTHGNVNYLDLGQYIISNVRKETGLKGLIQTPQIKVSHQLEEIWKDYYFLPQNQSTL